MKTILDYLLRTPAGHRVVAVIIGTITVAALTWLAAVGLIDAALIPAVTAAFGL